MSDPPKAGDKAKKPDPAGGAGGDAGKCGKGKVPEKKGNNGGHGPGQGQGQGHGQEAKEKHAGGRGGHK